MIERTHFPAPRFRLRALVAMVAPCAIVTLLTLGAQAAPLPSPTGAVTDSRVLQVRDGCGRGLRYSERRGGCVEDFDGGPGYDRGPPRDYDRRPPPPVVYERRPPPPPGYGPGPDYREPRGPAVPDCGRGMRFSERNQGCVRIEGAVEERNTNDVATGALVGGVVGGLLGSAIQNGR